MLNGSETPLQLDMFSNEWVDSRTEEQKREEYVRSLPQQLDLFLTHAFLSLTSPVEPAVNTSVRLQNSCTTLMLSPERGIVVYESMQHVNVDSPTPRALLAAPILLLLGAGALTEVPPARISDTLNSDLVPDETYFTERLEKLSGRIRWRIEKRWRDEFDVFELDNLVQAAIVHLWKGFRKNPRLFSEKNDTFWFAVAKQGAFQEITHEHRTRFRRKGKRGSSQKEKVQMVVNSDDILAAMAQRTDIEELDEALLSSDTIYRSDTPQILAADRRIDSVILIKQILSGTNPQDHPMITSIIEFMRQGLTQMEIARHKNVKVATIRVTIRRIQQAAGVFQTAKENRKRPRTSLDDRIRELRSQGLPGPAIGRLIGMTPSFVYSRLKEMEPKKF